MTLRTLPHKDNAAVVDGTECAIQKETKGKRNKRKHLAVEIEDGSCHHEDGKGTPEKNLPELVFKDGRRLRVESIESVGVNVDATHKSCDKV